MRGRVAQFIGSGISLAGAFLIGGLLHRSLVNGSISLLSPLAIGALGLGAGLVLGGQRLESRFEPGAVVVEPEEMDDTEEYNPENAPLSEGDMEGYERDDDYRG